MFVEEQIARSNPLLNRQGCQGVVFRVQAHHAAQIDGAEDIDVMQDERLCELPPDLDEKMRGLLQAAAGVEQLLFAGDLNSHAEVVGFEVIGNHRPHDDAR